MKQGHVDSLNATHARPGVVRRVFSGEGATLAFTTMDPGHEAVPHSHPHEQIEYLLQGRMHSSSATRRPSSSRAACSSSPAAWSTTA